MWPQEWLKWCVTVTNFEGFTRQQFCKFEYISICRFQIDVATIPANTFFHSKVYCPYFFMNGVQPVMNWNMCWVSNQCRTHGEPTQHRIYRTRKPIDTRINAGFSTGNCCLHIVCQVLKKWMKCYVYLSFGCRSAGYFQYIYT